jgi:hypothetical protein
VSHWLDPVRAALDGGDEPVRVFVRDDDVGWANERLVCLLDVCGDYGVVLDLAAIPQALTKSLALGLTRHRVEVHQHGLAHVNHEAVGRKCEFGPARARGTQRADIARGRDQLATLLGSEVRPIFTPPWNRCTRETAESLVELGFLTLSRDRSAGTFDLAGLRELPITFDWFAQRKGVPLSRTERGDLLAREMNGERPVGVMLHHALVDAEELRVLRELLGVLTAHPRVSMGTMTSLSN